MRPTFMGFETTKRGMMLNQKGLDIVSHNISNLGVTGYTRQRLDQVSITSQGTQGRYAAKPYTLAGQGADINGVTQVRDPYLDKRFRMENADVGYYNKMTEVLGDMETSLDDVDSAGLKVAIEKFNKAISTLHASAPTTTNANIVLTTAKSLTQVLRQYDVKLNNISNQQQYDLEVSNETVNSLMERIANLNESISKETFAKEGTNSAYFGPNELFDERNALLDELSQYADISVTTHPDNTIDVTVAGHAAVTGNRATTINFIRNSDNTVSLAWQDDGTSVDSNGGIFKASLDVINGRGGAGKSDHESLERGIPYYKDQLDSFSRTFADAFNNTIPVLDPVTNKPQTDPDGKVIYKQLFGFEQGKDLGASSIQVTKDWGDNPNFILLPTSADGAYDNTYYQSMLNVFSKDISFDTGFQGTMEGFVKGYVTTLGEDKQFNESRLGATAAITNSLLDNIAQVSGVSMDEEGADMMAYTKAYNAMSRMMTTLDEALDTLINRTGVVGR
ncbi:MAG: flagellar hook-associated protein FlgK [Angelakisella sp.]